MLTIYCSEPQQNDAVTPTPLVHRSHICMRALVLGHDTAARDLFNKFRTRAAALRLLTAATPVVPQVVTREV